MSADLSLKDYAHLPLRVFALRVLASASAGHSHFRSTHVFRPNAFNLTPTRAQRPCSTLAPFVLSYFQEGNFQDATSLIFLRAVAKRYNRVRVRALGTPVLKVDAKHSSKSDRSSG